MKRRELVYSRQALADYERIGVDSDRSWGRSRTRSYLRAIRDAARDLTANPGTGSDCSYILPGLRKRRSGVHLLFYRYSDSKVEVMRILHERMEVTGKL